MRPPSPRRTRALALAPLLALALGCAARREIAISSDPPGAEVRLDQRMLPGVTPMVVPFTHYGERRVTMYLEGYLSHSERVSLKAPWYARFPFDIVTEVLLPIGWRDRKRVRATLEPGVGAIAAPDLAGVLQRADTLRRAGPEGPRPMSSVRETPVTPEEPPDVPVPPPR